MTTEQKQVNYFRIIGWLIVALAVLIFVLIMSVPALLSTSWGNNFVQSQINKKIPGSVSLQRLHFSWFGDQRIEKVVLNDPDGKPVLSLDSLSANGTSLLRLFWNRGMPVHLSLSGLNATIVQNTDGESNLLKSLGIETQAKALPSSLPYTLILKDGEGLIDITGWGHPLAFQFKGKTDQEGQQGSFEVDAVLRGWAPEDVEQLTAKLTQFPIDLLDQFVAVQAPRYRGLLPILLGKTLDITLEHHKSGNGSSLALLVQSPNLQSSLSGHLTRDRFVSSAPSSLALTVSPDTFDHVQRVLAPQQLGRLAQPSQLNLDMDKWEVSFASTPMVKGDISLRSLPVAFVEAILAKDDLNAILGHALDCTMAIDWNAANASSGLLDIQFFGNQISGSAALRLTDKVELAHADQPARLEMVLTPERFTALRTLLRKDAKHNINLLENAKVSIFIDKLSIPKRYLDTQLQAQMAIDKLFLVDVAVNMPLNLEKMLVHVNSSQLSKGFNFDCRGQQRDLAGNVSDIFLTGQMQNILNKNDLALHVQAQANKLPVGFISDAVGEHKLSRQQCEAIFGPQVDITMQIQLNKWTGPVQIDVRGANGQLALDGQLNQRILTLNKPFVAELTASPQLSETVFVEFLPLLSGMIGAQERLRITVDPQGFALPLTQPEVENIDIGRATITLGQIYFTYEGQLGKILNVLHARSQEQIPVWFTPIYLSLSAGVLRVERFDMLAMDRYPIATWGTIDVPGDTVDMKIGLSGRSLKQVIGLPLPSDYMMQFPLTGTLGHASIDKTKLAARIATLTAQVAGGPQGLVLGTVLGLATGIYTEEKAPSPTTSPLPWATDEETAEVNEESNSKESIKKGIKKPLKQVEKVLNNLFR